jgi:glycosyltransferase involved in cell wall biosynthesis
MSKSAAARKRRPHAKRNVSSYGTRGGSAPLPSVALCVIACNEEQFIAQCLDSASAFVGEIVVLDTGSTDRTREIAREHGARVEEFTWCDDFSAARNVAIEACTADWILMLDADEELDPRSGPLLRTMAADLPQNMVGYSVTIENRQLDGSEAMCHFITRFFPRRSSLRFVGAIHEDLTYLPRPSKSSLYTSDLRIFHYGYDPGIYLARSKDARNMHLLERAYALDPENARLTYFLGQQHLASGRNDQAVEWLERFIARGEQVSYYFVVDAYRMLIEAHLRLNDPVAVERVVRVANAAHAVSAVAREVLARYEMYYGRLDQAEQHLLAALSPSAPVGIFTPLGTGGWRTRLLLAEVYERLEKRVAALEQLEHAFTELPSSMRLRIASWGARLGAAAGCASSASRWLARATAGAPDEVQPQFELFQAKLDVLRSGVAATSDVFASVDTAVAVYDWQAAYQAGLSLPLGGSAGLARIVFLATELREKGAPDAALDLLNRALDTYPASKSLYWPLVQVLTDLDRFEDALAASQVLDQLKAREAAPKAA